MNAKSLLQSKTVWIGWVLGALTGAIAALEARPDAQLPWWLAGVAPVLVVTLLPIARAVTSEIASTHKTASILSGAGMAFGGYLGAVVVSSPSAPAATITVSATDAVSAETSLEEVLELPTTEVPND
jgi:hypothetical protein